MTTMRRASAARRQCLVLLVDDSSESYELYSEVLAGAGYAVVGADDGEQALGLARRVRPDLVIMDDERHGDEATERLKRDPETRAIPIVMLTRSPSARDLERARRIGCDAFLAKPCPMGLLLDEVRRRMPSTDARRSGSLLVVEDDEDIRATVSTILTDEGYQVIDVADGAAALRYLRSGATRPSLILLDLMMPVMDGWGFRAAQLEDPELAFIPVVILSAANDLQERVRELHVEDCLAKPLDLPRLLDAIERHL